MVTATTVALLSLALGSQAHTTAWTKGMYCRWGWSHEPVVASRVAAIPVWNETYDGWWMNGRCKDYPPPPGDFLEVPANGQFTAELAENSAFTWVSFEGRLRTAWGDGKHHPDNYSVDNLGGARPSSIGCIGSPNLHCKRERDAAGTVFAIAYKNDISNISMEELVVFTVAPHSPYRLLTTYEVPDLPSCPEGGCICVWGWVPNHCGQANVYFHPHRCIVTGARPEARRPVPARPPVWCEGESDKCLRGPKQLVIAHQFEGNNVQISGRQADGLWKSPGYNMKMGFHPGAQHDIFDDPYEFTDLPAPSTPDDLVLAGDEPQAVFEPHVHNELR
ncbi:hypothetical protein BKA62DRAFT_650346 [Auriculariales sp. MPI-PUGE-AT-0066]|nr:hypothetical protein BKA62DRAFT_650346 [Auriculariales sp. MPI-PUGE-AT-0066]